ncbi:MAG: hypothetical protein B6240_14750 [Desulfobacteraceae bacterium 4572_87]|nr:MAG: hypothetical protein B6240_14750 [Desulfobacteraceae bacterium 4572_87]
MQPKDIQKSCLHESTHAAIAWVRGLKIRELNISEDRWSSGGPEEGSYLFCDIQGTAMTHVGKLTSKDIIDRIMVHLSPQAFSKDLAGDGADADIESAMRFLSFGSVTDPKARELIESARELEGSPDAAKRFYERHKSMVQDVFDDPKIRSVTKSLAKHLEAVETMSGVEVAQFLEEVHGEPYPKDAVPSREQPVSFRNEQSLAGAIAAVSGLTKAAREILNLARVRDEDEENTQESLMVKLLAIQFATE